MKVREEILAFSFRELAGTDDADRRCGRVTAFHDLDGVCSRGQFLDARLVRPTGSFEHQWMELQRTG